MKNLLSKKLQENEFVNSIELVPPKGINLSNVLDKIRKLKKVEIFNVVDSPLSDPRMHPIALCHKIKTVLHKEPIMHYACRDRNKVGIEADLLAAYELGLRNILALTGDPCRNGKGVFELCSPDLIEFIHQLNKKHDMDYLVGCGININARGFEQEIKRTQKKIGKGAEFVVTQPCPDLDRIQKVIKELDVPVILGFVFSFDKQTLEFLKHNVPGIKLSDELIQISDDKQKILDYYRGLLQEMGNANLSGISFEAADDFESIEKVI